MFPLLQTNSKNVNNEIKEYPEVFFYYIQDTFSLKSFEIKTIYPSQEMIWSLKACQSFMVSSDYWWATVDKRDFKGISGKKRGEIINIFSISAKYDFSD